MIIKINGGTGCHCMSINVRNAGSSSRFSDPYILHRKKQNVPNARAGQRRSFLPLHALSHPEPAVEAVHHSVEAVEVSHPAEPGVQKTKKPVSKYTGFLILKKSLTF